MSPSWCPWWPPYVFFPTFPGQVKNSSPSPSLFFSGAGIIAFATRAGVNLVLLLARIKSLTKYAPYPVFLPIATHSTVLPSQREAFCSHPPCPIRVIFVPCCCYARWVHHSSLPTHLVIITASFVALYRIILNALPLLFPANVPVGQNFRNLASTLFSNQDENRSFEVDDSPTSSSSPSPLARSPVLSDRREARLSSSARVHQEWVRKKSRRWHSVLAGAIAGAIAVSFEKRSRQTVIAQQLFVRYVLFISSQYSTRVIMS
jgi:hypothetical protein